MEIEHEQAINNLQDQLRITKEELQQLKIRLLAVEELPGISQTSPIGIKDDLNRDKIPAWNVVVVSARQQEEKGEVNMHFSLTSLIETCALSRTS